MCVYVTSSILLSVPIASRLLYSRSSVALAWKERRKDTERYWILTSSREMIISHHTIYLRWQHLSNSTVISHHVLSFLLTLQHRLEILSSYSDFTVIVSPQWIKDVTFNCRGTDGRRVHNPTSRFHWGRCSYLLCVQHRLFWSQGNFISNWERFRSVWCSLSFCVFSDVFKKNIFMYFLYIFKY